MNDAWGEVKSKFNPGALEHPVLNFFLGYWRAKCASRSMPSRGDIAPKECKAVLGNMLLIDVVEEGRAFRYRMVGTEFARYFLFDPTGKTVEEALPPPDDDHIEGVVAALKAVTARRLPLYSSVPAKDVRGVFFEAFESLWAPLSDDGSTVNCILQCIVYDPVKVKVGQIAQGVRRTVSDL